MKCAQLFIVDQTYKICIKKLRSLKLHKLKIAADFVKALTRSPVAKSNNNDFLRGAQIDELCLRRDFCCAGLYMQKVSKKVFL